MTGLVVEACDPRERTDQIKDLFARNGQPQFDAAFERAYRSRAEIGLKSWLGQLGDQAVMHISVSPIEFSNGVRTLRGGVMGDLMVEEAQRDFWAPVRLLRQVVADLKKDGSIDFLLTTTTSDAEAVFRAAGFKTYGDLQRHVLPLNRAYLGLARLRARAARVRPARVEMIAPAPGPAVTAGDMWRPVPSERFYRTRVEREEFEDATWLEMKGSRNGAGVGFAMLSKHHSQPEIGFADAFWGGGADLPAVALAAGRWAARAGYPKMCVSTLAESRLSAELKRAGFFPRAVRSVMLVQKIREVPPVEDLFLTGFSLSSW